MLAKSVLSMLALFYLWIITDKTATGECEFFRKETLEILNPPPPDKYALMARYIIRNSSWVALATISAAIKGYPFVTLKSLSDGMSNNSTGVPYLYISNRDISGHDILVNNSVTIMASLAESDYCEKHSLDPQDPRCAKVMISGPIIKVANGTAEYTFALNSLFEKHPSMKYWPADHGFYVAKIIIHQILILDHFGGAANVSVEEYFKATPNDFINLFSANNSPSVILN